MAHNFLNKNRTGGCFCRFINPDRMFPLSKSDDIIGTDHITGYFKFSCNKFRPACIGDNYEPTDQKDGKYAAVWSGKSKAKMHSGTDQFQISIRIIEDTFHTGRKETALSVSFDAANDGETKKRKKLK